MQALCPATSLHDVVPPQPDDDPDLQQTAADQSSSLVLPGFRFHPTEEELIGFYLKRRVDGKHISIELIKMVDLYRYDPWQLPALAVIGEKEWFFFTPRDKKYPNGARPNRVTTSGYWKATGTDKLVRSSQGISIGLKKTLVFYSGRAPKGLRTHWVMNEYRLLQKEYTDASKYKNEVALCKVYTKSSSELFQAGHLYSGEAAAAAYMREYKHAVTSTTSGLYKHRNIQPCWTSHWQPELFLREKNPSNFVNVGDSLGEIMADGKTEPWKYFAWPDSVQGEVALSVINLEEESTGRFASQWSNLSGSSSIDAIEIVPDVSSISTISSSLWYPTKPISAQPATNYDLPVGHTLPYQYNTAQTEFAGSCSGYSSTTASYSPISSSCFSRSYSINRTTPTDCLSDQVPPFTAPLDPGSLVLAPSTQLDKLWESTNLWNIMPSANLQN